MQCSRIVLSEGLMEQEGIASFGKINLVTNKSRNNEIFKTDDLGIAGQPFISELYQKRG